MSLYSANGISISIGFLNSICILGWAVNDFISKFNCGPYTKFVDTWNKNQCPRSTSGGRASLLKFSGRNSIGEKMGKLLFFELTCMQRVTNSSKNKNRNNDFSFDSAHCASFMKVESKLRGGERLHILSWDRAETIYKLSENFSQFVNLGNL